MLGLSSRTLDEQCYENGLQLTVSFYCFTLLPGLEQKSPVLDAGLLGLLRQWKMDFILFQKADISLELGFCTCYDDLELQPLLSAAISLN